MEAIQKGLSYVVDRSVVNHPGVLIGSILWNRKGARLRYHRFGIPAFSSPPGLPVEAGVDAPPRGAVLPYF